METKGGYRPVYDYFPPEMTCERELLIRRLSSKMTRRKASL